MRKMTWLIWCTSFTITCTDAVAVWLSAPFAVATHVTVFFGVTDRVPPVPGRVPVNSWVPLLSLQTTPTPEALAAVTVNVELCPGLTPVGSAVIVTVGFGWFT